MTTYLRKAFLVPWKPSYQTVRFRNKINIQRPALPHYQRAKVLKICEPLYPRPRTSQRPSVELCLKPVENQRKKDEEKNKFAEILAKEMYTTTDKSQFIGFFHTCPTPAEVKFKVRVAIHKLNGEIKQYGRAVAEKAWKDTYYDPALCLYKSHTTLVFCPDGSPQTVADIMKIFRRVPSLILMAAIIDKRMMDYNELEWYSKLTDLTTERAKLASLLSAAGGGSLIQDLNTLQGTLVNQLSQRASQLESSATSDPGVDHRKLGETT
ncbi:39S ribosomal protein L10, mitochondrial [Ischnura elegans]|uniref:39S ribosomal protein L10, mitochondrial n=1 Tax=Ischnura elegans TaxID=197161 RepID=UPI001ED8B7C6|nr:39S ribosomal protein L10, mitochondrial [Ischnura elegans]